MSYPAKAIANEFLDIAKEQGVTDMTPIKVQKLIYFAHGWYLAFFKEPLIREGVQAWKFGPVIADVYHEFKSWSNEPVEQSAKAFNYENRTVIEITPKIKVEDTQTKEHLLEVFRIYGQFTPIQLANITHESGTPWAIVADKFDSELPKNELIPDSLIQDYFERKLRDSAA